MKSLDEQVREALRAVPGSYDSFVSVAGEFRGKPEKQNELLIFLKAHPEAGTGKVLRQISNVILPEIMEDEDDDEYEEE